MALSMVIPNKTLVLCLPLKVELQIKVSSERGKKPFAPLPSMTRLCGARLLSDHTLTSHCICRKECVRGLSSTVPKGVGEVGSDMSSNASTKTSSLVFLYHVDVLECGSHPTLL